MRYLNIICALIFFGFNSQLDCKIPLLHLSNKNEITKFKFMEDNGYSAEDILAGEMDGEMVEVNREVFSFSGKKNVYWLKGNVVDKENTGNYLRSWKSRDARVTLYWIEDDSLHSEHLTNIYGEDGIVLSQRDLFAKLSDEAKKNFLLRIELLSFSYKTSFSISTMDEILQNERSYSKSSNFIQFIQLSFLVILFLIYLFLRREYYLYFFFYILFSILSPKIVDWKDHLGILFKHIYFLVIFLFLVSFCKFFQNAFFTKDRMPKASFLLDLTSSLLLSCWLYSALMLIFGWKSVFAVQMFLLITLFTLKDSYKNWVYRPPFAFVVGGFIALIFNFSIYKNVVNFLIFSDICLTTFILVSSIISLRRNFLISILIILGWSSRWLILIMLSVERYFGGFTIDIRWDDLAKIIGTTLDIFAISPFLIYNSINLLRERKVSKNAEDFVRSFEHSNSLEDALKNLLKLSSININYDKAFFLIRDDIITSKGNLNLGFYTFDESLKIIELFFKAECGYLLSNDSFSSDKYNDLLMEMKRYNSIILFRLVFNDRDSGYVFFLSKNYGSYDSTFSGYVEDFAQKASVAIQHFKHLEEISESKSKLEAERAIKVYQQTLTHDIKSPLLAIKIGAKSIRELYRSKWTTDKKMEEYLSLIELAAREAQEEVEESMSIAKERYQKFSLDFLQDSLIEVKKVCEYENIAFIEMNTLDSETQFYGPQKSVKNVLRSIVKNAVEAFEGCEKVDKKINIVYKQEDGMVKILVSDNAKGIKKEHLGKLFTHFSYGKEYGTGHGLTLAREMAKRLGGDILISSREGVGTEVNITLDILFSKPKAV